jgi:hypothetical protein
VPRERLPAERPKVDEPFAGKKSDRLLMFRMIEELCIFEGEGLVGTALYIHNVEQYAQVPVVETEAEKEEGGFTVG